MSQYMTPIIANFLTLLPTNCWVRDQAPQLNNQGCDNVLPGQGYHTPQGVMTDEFGAMVK
jgi:hypothetical protein